MAKQSMKSSLAQYIILLLLMTGVCHASNRNHDFKNLLFKAKENSQNSSFKATAVAFDDPKISWVFYQKGSKNGEQPLLRREVLTDGRVRETKIRNQTGWYLIWNNIASKDEYANFDWSPGAIIDESLIEEARILVTSTSYNGVPCYKVTVQCPNNIESLMRKAGCSRQWAEENHEKLKKQFCQLYSFLIDRKRMFIYSTKIFVPNGNLVYQLDLKQVIFNPMLPDHLFQIAEEMEKGETFRTEAEMDKAFVVKKYFWHTWGETIENFFSNHIDSILRTGGEIAFWLAIVAVILASVLKFRAKRLSRSR